MPVDIDKSAATKLLHASYVSCSAVPVTSCVISDTIDFVMEGKNCLTYRYIMFTAVVAKAVDPSIDILSLQAGDDSVGAYDARSLASKVIYPFQKQMLGNTLDGSNNDPLVNKPGRFLRLRKSNPVAGGDPKKALNALCDDLPRVKTGEEARTCVDYIVSKLLIHKEHRARQLVTFEFSSQNASVFSVREFLSDLLDQSFGGASLVLVTAALYDLQFIGDEYLVSAHPVNQSGSSRRQFSDLDVLRDGMPFMGTELKDKPFTASDVDHAAETAYSVGASSLLFIAGRQSSFASQPPTYFSKARSKYAQMGMYVGVTSIDALIDVVFAAHMDMDASRMFDVVRSTAEKIGALEAQMWVYSYLANIPADSRPPANNENNRKRSQDILRALV